MRQIETGEALLQRLSHGLHQFPTFVKELLLKAVMHDPRDYPSRG